MSKEKGGKNNKVSLAALVLRNLPFACPLLPSISHWEWCSSVCHGCQLGQLFPAVLQMQEAHSLPVTWVSALGHPSGSLPDYAALYIHVDRVVTGPFSWTRILPLGWASLVGITPGGTSHYVDTWWRSLSRVLCICLSKSSTMWRGACLGRLWSLNYWKFLGRD